MRYLKRKDNGNGILLGTSEEDTISLRKIWEDQVIRGAYLFWSGGKITDPQVEELIKNFPDTKSFILINRK
jgi:hypothetical protein